VVNEGILFEIREKERYKKPSERRQEKIKRVKHQIKLEKKRD
jgi:ribosomal protein S21